MIEMLHIPELPVFNFVFLSFERLLSFMNGCYVYFKSLFFLGQPAKITCVERLLSFMICFFNVSFPEKLASQTFRMKKLLSLILKQIMWLFEKGFFKL